MKKIILLIAISISLIANAQIDSTELIQVVNDKFIISNVEQVNETTSAELYKRALMWVNDNFVANRTTYDVKDSETGILLVNGVHKNWATIKFKMSIQTKDNRYKWEISEIFVDWENYEMAKMFNQSFEKEHEGNKASALIYFMKAIRDLENKMKIKDSW